eukprot:scaffold180883_cov22-Tisochrysis_lutea.AAC.5
MQLGAWFTSFTITRRHMTTCPSPHPRPTRPHHPQSLPHHPHLRCSLLGWQPGSSLFRMPCCSCLPAPAPPAPPATTPCPGRSLGHPDQAGTSSWTAVAGTHPGAAARPPD